MERFGDEVGDMDKGLPPDARLVLEWTVEGLLEEGANLDRGEESPLLCSASPLLADLAKETSIVLTLALEGDWLDLATFPSIDLVMATALGHTVGLCSLEDEEKDRCFTKDEEAEELLDLPCETLSEAQDLLCEEEEEAKATDSFLTKVVEGNAMPLGLLVLGFDFSVSSSVDALCLILV